MLSSNYDIDTIYIDGLFNIVNLDNEDAALLFFELEKLEEEYSLDIYMNVNEENDIPECMRKYTGLLCV